jgi:L-alanine-DL-glutamate epimerase-like enolase superfamily enzyme
MRSTDVRVASVRVWCQDYRYRTPIKFGGTASDRVTLANVEMDVRTRAHKSARGFGSMPLGNIWSFPSRVLTYEETLAAMKALVERIALAYEGCRDYGHPVDLTWALEAECDRAAAELTTQRQLAEPIPRLCTLVCQSPVDAALHDAFGKAHGLSCYHIYGPDFMSHDLGHYLGPEFTGQDLERHVFREPQPRLPMYHLVGALDPLTPADVSRPVGDGLPEMLTDWIRHNGLTHLKIKLNGDDLAWDVERVLAVERVAAQTQAQRGVRAWRYSLDFNERCGSVGHLLEFLARVREGSPEAFTRISYVEQPTARDLRALPQNPMHKAAELRPVVIDESLLDLQSLQDARALGYTGAALKACKGQTHSLLLGAAAQRYRMFLCVQDLTCPGASLIHSAGLAAHVPGVSAIEANARQYVPQANAGWEDRFPGIFCVTDGTMETGVLTGPGLGAV